MVFSNSGGSFTNPFQDIEDSSNELDFLSQLEEQYNAKQDSLEDYIGQLKNDNALVNIHSGLGEPGRDLLSSGSVRIAPASLSPAERTLWRHHSFIFGNLVEILPSAMVSKFVAYSCSDSKGSSSESQARLEQVRPFIEQAINEATEQVEGRVSEFSLSTEALPEDPALGEADPRQSRLRGVSSHLQGIIEQMLVQSEASIEMTAWMQDKLKEVKSYIQEALEEAREQGGAGIILYADDGGVGIDQPLDLENLNDIEGYNVMSSEDLEAYSYYKDKNNKKYGEIETYKVNFNNAMHGEDYNRSDKHDLIHSSRVIAFHGRKVNKKLRRINHGWGYSVIDRAFIPVTNFIQGSNCVASSLQSFSQTVLFIHDLAKKIAAGKKEQVKEHVRTIAFLRHALGILALDGEHEKYEILSRNYSNVEKILEHLAQMAAGACDLPLNLLLNRTSSDALNSAIVSNNTGGGNQSKQDWSDYVFARQGSDMMPQIQTDLIPILHACKANPLKGKEPSKWQVNRVPIATESPQEMAKTKQILANAIALLLDRHVLDPFEVAKALATNVDIFSTIDLEQRLREKVQMQMSPEYQQNVVVNRVQKNIPQSAQQSTRDYKSQQQASTQKGEQGAVKSSPQIQT
ncbi:MAG TPA: anti-CBASS Acb1 family protein [Phormidium sp.]